jgi:hypothetical protein
MVEEGFERVLECGAELAQPFEWREEPFHNLITESRLRRNGRPEEQSLERVATVMSNERVERASGSGNASPAVPT